MIVGMLKNHIVGTVAIAGLIVILVTMRIVIRANLLEPFLHEMADSFVLIVLAYVLSIIWRKIKG